MEIQSNVSSGIYASTHGAISGESRTEFLCPRKNGYM
ncbi:hypothetical protein PC116_g6345 [Phytophthora cactorum]|nr:hypothetical protein PC116_g6345 [Phytophthora cactorum]